MQSLLNVITLQTYTFFTALTPRLHGRSKRFFRRPQNLNAPRTYTGRRCVTPKAGVKSFIRKAQPKIRTQHLHKWEIDDDASVVLETYAARLSQIIPNYLATTFQKRCHQSSRRLGLPEFLDRRRMKVVRLPALRTGRLYSAGDTHGTHFCQRLSRPPRNTVRPQ